MGSRINKQYLCLSGLPILLYTLRVFEEVAAIDEIIVVAAPGEEEFCRVNVINSYGLKKVSKIIAGGLERQQSVYNGLRAVDSDTEVVLIHDGARPLVDEGIIHRVLDGARRYGAVSCGVPVKDTIKMVDGDGFVSSTPDRSLLWSIQTPQGFRLELLMEAHNQALKEGLLGTDDAMLVERMGQPVKVVLGSYDNIKVTTPEDLAAAEAIIARRRAEG
ncbi:MAG: 2-C-methyl-D-erythritol 4-phosphate cytidylyltransferase [Clostridia bacterium]|nr:2-C-methyl-D-erythritol 4-phosphate cytidylyltransferase [Clostridia bacterium]